MRGGTLCWPDVSPAPYVGTRSYSGSTAGIHIFLWWLDLGERFGGSRLLCLPADAAVASGLTGGQGVDDHMSIRCMIKHCARAVHTCSVFLRCCRGQDSRLAPLGHQSHRSMPSADRS